MNYIFFHVEYRNRESKSVSLINDCRAKIKRKLEINFGKKFQSGNWFKSQINNEKYLAPTNLLKNIIENSFK